MHVFTDYTLVYTSKEFGGNGVRTHVNSKGRIPFTGISEKDGTHKVASHRIASPTHYPLSYSGPIRSV